MCDSNRVKGTVKQYLVTEDNDIVVNDLGTFWICISRYKSGGAIEWVIWNAIEIDKKVENVIRWP